MKRQNDEQKQITGIRGPKVTHLCLVYAAAPRDSSTRLRPRPDPFFLVSFFHWQAMKAIHQHIKMRESTIRRPLARFPNARPASQIVSHKLVD